jgi:phage-related protein
MALAKFDFSYNRAWQDEIRFNTLITQFESGKEQRRAKGLPRRIFRLNFEKSTTSNTDAEEIYQFFVARKGRYESFHWDYSKSDGETEEVEVRFDMDTMSRETFLQTIYRFGLTFIEVI